MHTPMAKILWYQWMDRCNWATDMRLQWRDLDMAQKTGEMNFSMYYREDDPLVEGVKLFQYLVRTPKQTDSDCLSVHRKIVKA